MYFGDYKFHAVPYFLSSRFLPLDFLYFKSVAVLMHDISNNLLTPNIANLFISKASIHSYKTRSSSRGDYFVKPSRLDKQIQSLMTISIYSLDYFVKPSRLDKQIESLNDYIDLFFSRSGNFAAIRS